VKPVNMLVQTDPLAGTFGDCARACVASIFELPATWVPHFCEFGVEDPGPTGELPWVVRLREWLGQFGLTLFVMVVSGPQDRPSGAALQFHHMRGSRTSLGADHWTVYFGDELAHDPHPESGFQDNAYPQHLVMFVKA
jgi:hypothetical protein